MVSAGGVDTAYAAVTLDGFPFTFLAEVDLARAPPRWAPSPPSLAARGLAA